MLPGVLGSGLVSCKGICAFPPGNLRRFRCLFQRMPEEKRFEERYGMSLKHGSLPQTPYQQIGSQGNLRPLRLTQFPLAQRRTLLMQGDMVATLLSVMMALWLWAVQAQEPFNIQFIWQRVFWFFVLAHANDYYDLRITSHFSSSMARLAWVTLQLVLVYGTIFLFAPLGILPRRFIIYYALGSLALITAWRASRLFLARWSRFRRRALIVGTGSASEVIWQAIKQEVQRDYEIVGYVTSAQDRSALPARSNTLGFGGELTSIVHQYGISELIVSYVNNIPNDIFQGLMACYGQGVAIVPMPVLYEQITGRIPIELVGQHLWALVLPHQDHSLTFNLYQTAKWIVDRLD